MSEYYKSQENWLDSQTQLLSSHAGNSPISPSEVHNLAKSNFERGRSARPSNILLKTSPSPAFLMYVVESHREKDELTVRHYTGYTMSEVKYVLIPASGTTRLHKYTSTDGTSWHEVADSPQSVWWEDPLHGGIPKKAEYYGLLPLPYLDTGGFLATVSPGPGSGIG